MKRSATKDGSARAASFYLSIAITLSGRRPREAILKRTGASDIATTGEARADFARTEKPMPRTRVESRTTTALVNLVTAIVILQQGAGLIGQRPFYALQSLPGSTMADRSPGTILQKM